MMNTGDTGFMLICTAFVFFMTPGLAFFYGYEFYFRQSIRLCISEADIRYLFSYVYYCTIIRTMLRIRRCAG